MDTPIKIIETKKIKNNSSARVMTHEMDSLIKITDKNIHNVMYNTPSYESPITSVRKSLNFDSQKGNIDTNQKNYSGNMLTSMSKSLIYYFIHTYKYLLY